MILQIFLVLSAPQKYIFSNKSVRAEETWYKSIQQQKVDLWAKDFADEWIGKEWAEIIRKMLRNKLQSKKVVESTVAQLVKG